MASSRSGRSSGGSEPQPSGPRKEGPNEPSENAHTASFAGYDEGSVQPLEQISPLVASKHSKGGVAANAISRTMPTSGRNASLSWTDIMCFGDAHGSSLQKDMNSQEAPSGLACETNDERDRITSKSMVNGASISQQLNASRTTKRGPEQATTAASSVTSNGRILGATHKVDTWRPESPKFKRKDESDTHVVADQAQAQFNSTAQSQPQPQPHSQLQTRRHTIMVKDCETSMSNVTSIISSPKVSNAETLTANYERPPSPVISKRAEILPKVDTWRGDRSPDARRRKMMQIQADVCVGTDHNPSIGLQACSLDFLVSVEAEVKPEIPPSPTLKKVVLHKVDTRWKSGLPRRETESSHVQNILQADGSMSASTSQLLKTSIVNAVQDGVHSLKNKETDISPSEESPVLGESQNPMMDSTTVHSTTVVYHSKRHSALATSSAEAAEQASINSPHTVQRAKRQASIINDARKSALALLNTSRNDVGQSKSENFSRPSSPVIRKRQPDSAIVSSPSPTTNKEASVDEVDAYIASSPMDGSMRQTASAQRVRAAYLSAGKHVPLSESVFNGISAATDNMHKDSKALELPIHIAVPNSWKNTIYSPNAPLVALLIFVLAVLEILTGDSALQYHQGCRQIESAYSNSGAVVCQRY